VCQVGRLAGREIIDGRTVAPRDEGRGLPEATMKRGSWQMKKRVSLLTVVFTVAGMIGMALPAAAADLHTPQQGTPCYGAVCVWHLVNVQAGDKPHDLILDEVKLGNANVVSVVVTKDNKHNVQWEVTTQRISSGAPQLLKFLSTDNGGKIVISDYYCKCGCGCGCK
jgi:hypothetical protein